MIQTSLVHTPSHAATGLRAAGFWTAVSLSVIVALVSLRFLSGNPLVAGPDIRPSMVANGWIFVAHAAAAAVALGLGGFQFVGALRRRWPRLHRGSGRGYVLACLLGALTALWIAPDASSGRLATFGFSVLAAAWIYTTLTAWRLAVQRDFAAHRRWMIRSFALTFAAVTLRLQILAVLPFGLTYGDVSQVLAYSAWIPNLLVVELAFLLATYRRAAAPGGIQRASSGASGPASSP